MSWLNYTVEQNGCALWTRGLDKEGYAITGFNYKQYRVARLVYAAYVGIPSIGEVVCHTCDNKSCINPIHLFAGSIKDNSHDMMLKGRHPRSKLSEDAVQEIRRRYNLFKITGGSRGKSLAAIAKDYNTTASYVCMVGKRRRKTWLI